MLTGFCHSGLPPKTFQKKNLKFIATSLAFVSVRSSLQLRSPFSAAVWSRCKVITQSNIIITGAWEMNKELTHKGDEQRACDKCDRSEVLGSFELRKIRTPTHAYASKTDESSENLYFLIILLPLTPARRHKSISCR